MDYMLFASVIESSFNKKVLISSNEITIFKGNWKPVGK